MPPTVKPTLVAAKPASVSAKPTAVNPVKPAGVTAIKPAKPTSERNTGTEDGQDGAEGEDDEEEAPSRPIHPAVGSSEKELYPFVFTREALTLEGKTFPAVTGNFPADFSHTKHRYLKRTDFVSAADFAAYKLDAQREKFQRAESKYHDALLGRSSTSASPEAGSKRLAKMLKRIQELRKSLAGSGVDVAAIEKLVASETEA